VHLVLKPNGEAIGDHAVAENSDCQPGQSEVRQNRGGILAERVL
jgi:hypothetical protein